MASDQISLEEYLERLNRSIPKLETKAISGLTTEPISSLTYSSTLSEDDYHGVVPTYSIGSGTATGIWTTTHTNVPNVTISAPTWTTTTNPYTTVDQGGKIKLQGQNADIDINGKSLKAWMERVEERLNMLTPNPEMEAEWEQLRKLGERYRKLEKKCQEKTEVWKQLKAMPKVEVK